MNKCLVILLVYYKLKMKILRAKATEDEKARKNYP